MKTIATAFGAILIAVSLSSCYAPYAKEGAVVGGLIGAGTGAIIGNQSCRPLEGAAIGGAIGALGGGLIGSAQDDRARYHQGSNYSGNGGGYDKGGYGYSNSPPPPPRNDYRGPRDDYRPRADNRGPRDDYRGPRDDYRY